MSSLTRAVASRSVLWRHRCSEAAKRGSSNASGARLLSGARNESRGAVGAALRRLPGNGPVLGDASRGGALVRRQKHKQQFFSSGRADGLSNAMLRQLEQEAMNAPGDVAAETRFFTALAKKYPVQAMERLESNEYPMSTESYKAYVDAALATGKPVNIDLMGAAGARGRGGMGGGIAAGLGSASAPIYVKAAGETWKGWFQSTGPKILSLFITLTILGSFLDLSGMGSRLMPQSNLRLAENSDTKFEDVLGVDEAKLELEEIVMYLKNPEMFTRLGGKLPKGLMLVGPPGTGKTLLARAIAGEAGVPFFYTSGSEFEEMFVGLGAKRVRDLFEAAKKHSPCIIFIDEIDAIGGKRQVRDSNGAMRMTLNQLLTEMDGFSQNTGIIVIGATNFPDVLDKALTRPGRFDKQVQVPLPDVKGREEILQLYGSKTKLAPGANLKALAQGTPGMSGADLSNLVNQAAVKASLDGEKMVTTEALEWARDKIQMGAERRSAVISKETAKLTAYHEGGHAIVALKTAGAHPVHKATIMPRGRALGYVMQLPEGDQTSMSRKQMLAKMDVCMGGRVAEEMVFGHDNVTSGATSDFQQATNLARAMVTQYGMSEKVGTVFIEDRRQEGDDMRVAIDAEVKDLLDKSYKRAWNCLQTHRRDLETLARALLQYESLTGAEINDVLAGKPIKSMSVSPRLQTPVPTGGGGAAVATALAAKAAAAKAAAAATAATSAAARASQSGRSAEGGDAGPEPRII